MAFIVFEGNDGSGKATQTALLTAALEREGIGVDTYAFPRYKETIGGKLLAKLLSDPKVNFSTVDPRLGSLPYALDRFESSSKIRESLDAGRVFVADRFISANQVHQGGKMKSDGERIGFLTWLDDLEHGLYGIPHPDLVIYLKAPVDISLGMLAEKRASKGGLLADGEMDQVEKDRQYLENSHNMANWLAGRYDHWRVVNCIDDEGRLRSREAIHEDVMTEVRAVIT